MMNMKTWFLFLSAALLFTPQMSMAVSATWLDNPADNEWCNDLNWDPQGVPDGTTDEATSMGRRLQTSISIVIYR
jgi:hypothetical protein